MRSILLAAAAAASLAVAGISVAKPVSVAFPEETTEFRPGPEAGRQAAINNCMACHSVDYVEIQPPKMGKGFWHAEVVKMINVYKASIDKADVDTIAAYLAEAY